MSKPFKIVCSELDMKFQVHTEKGQFVALAPSAKPHWSAKWENKKIAPKALWESVSTEQERLAINALLDEPGLTKSAAMVKLAELQIAFSTAANPSRNRSSKVESDGPGR